MLDTHHFFNYNHNSSIFHSFREKVGFLWIYFYIFLSVWCKHFSWLNHKWIKVLYIVIVIMSFIQFNVQNSISCVLLLLFITVHTKHLFEWSFLLFRGFDCCGVTYKTKLFVVFSWRSPTYINICNDKEQQNCLGKISSVNIFPI